MVDGVSQSLHFRYAPNCAGFMGDRGHGLLAHCVCQSVMLSVVIEIVNAEKRAEQIIIRVIY